jgi:Flp pilus assembly pilin Flp
MNSVDKMIGLFLLRLKKLSARVGHQGQTIVEYALILAIISIVAIGVMINLGKGISGIYSTITSTIASGQASH